MPQRINVPGIGIVEFPDDMNDEQISAAIKANMPSMSSQQMTQNNGMQNALSSYLSTLSPMKTGSNVLSGLLSQFAPKGQQELYKNLPNALSGQQPGLAQQIPQVAGEIAPYALMPEAELGALGKGISAIPKVGPYASEVVSRTAPQVAYGAATSENPAETAKNIAGWQGALEAATLPFKGASSIAEFMNPLKFTKNEMGNIKNEYQNALQEQKSYYDPVNMKYNEQYVTNNPKEFLGFKKSQEKYFTPDIKKLKDDFYSDPTFGNLHKLQSQMYKDSAKLSANPSKINTYQTIKNSRNEIKDKIKSFLSSDPEALSSYLKGAEVTKNKVSPFESTPSLRKISTGKIEEMEPKKLINTIKKATEKENINIPNDHYLREALAKVQRKSDIGKSAQYGIPIAGSILGGEMLHPGIGGAIGGLSVGSMLGHYLNPAMQEIAQNPTLSEALKKLSKPYYAGGSSVIGYEQNK